MGLCKRRVQLHGMQGGCPSLRKNSRGRLHAVIAEQVVAGREAGLGGSVSRVRIDRLLEIPDGFMQVRSW